MIPALTPNDVDLSPVEVAVFVALRSTEAVLTIEDVCDFAAGYLRVPRVRLVTAREALCVLDAFGFVAPAVEHVNPVDAWEWRVTDAGRDALGQAS
jgi:hypothetical protein